MDGSFVARGRGGAGVRGQNKQVLTIPLPAATARVKGQIAAPGMRATARRRARARRAGAADGPPQGMRVSAQSVLACNPWLKSA